MTATDQLAPPARPLHIVDQLIEERAERLMRRPWLWALLKPVLYPALHYGKARDLADEIRHRNGRAAMDWAAGYLNLHVDCGSAGLPSSGPCALVANHPGGIADGIALWTMLRDRRPDLAFFANRDALRVCPGLADLVIPVEWRPEQRTRDHTRETLRQALAAFKDGRCVVIFPAGRMAEWRWNRRHLVERPWQTSAVSLARKFDAPLIPVGIAQSLTWLYYAFALVSEELKNMTVFHELLAKRGAHYRIRLGTPVTARTLGLDDRTATEELRRRAEALAWGTGGRGASIRKPAP